MIDSKIVDSIGIFKLARLGVHNAINREMMMQIAEILIKWKEDEKLK